MALRNIARILGNAGFHSSTRLTVLFIWIGAFITWTYPSLAQTLEGYCLSRLEGNLPENQSPLNSTPPRLTVSSGGKTFYVEVTSTDGVLELRDENNSSFAQVTALQSWYGPRRIQQLVLGKNGWLWIKGSVMDYMARLDLNSIPPTLDNPIPVPDDIGTSNRCSFLGRFWNPRLWCAPATGIFSVTLDRAFITAYPKDTLLTLFGLSSPNTYEMQKGQIKPLPKTINFTSENCIFEVSDSPGNGCQKFLDIPPLNGILYKGQSSEALLYDGKTVKKIFDPAKLDAKPNWSVALNSFKNRAFLEMTALDGKSFILEIKSGPIFSEPLFVPDDVADKWFWAFSFPQDRHFWGVNSHAVVLERDGQLQTIIRVTNQYIKRSRFLIKNTGTDTGAIQLTIGNYNNKPDIGYAITAASPLVKCLAVIDPNNPIEIGNK